MDELIAAIRLLVGQMQAEAEIGYWTAEIGRFNDECPPTVSSVKDWLEDEDNRARGARLWDRLGAARLRAAGLGAGDVGA